MSQIATTKEKNLVEDVQKIFSCITDGENPPPNLNFKIMFVPESRGAFTPPPYRFEGDSFYSIRLFLRCIFIIFIVFINAHIMSYVFNIQPDGYYVFLLKSHTVPEALANRVLSDRDISSMSGRWKINRIQTHNSMQVTFKMRLCYSVNDPACVKKGVVYTMVRFTTYTNHHDLFLVLLTSPYPLSLIF